MQPTRADGAALDPDILLIAGLVVASFSIPSIISAYADRRAPTIAVVMLLMGGGLVLLALTTRPGGYTLQDVPHALLRVLAQILP